MTSDSTTNPARPAGPSVWRLLAAVGFVLGTTAYTVQAFVESTAALEPVAFTLPQVLPQEALEPACADHYEITFASDGTYLFEVGAVPLQCEVQGTTEG